MGVPSIRSAPLTSRTGPSGVLGEILMRRTEDNPIWLGRKGLRVAHTPMRLLPPSRGGRTVGLHPSPSLWASLKSQSSQMCENPSNPRKASALRYSGSKMIRPVNSLTRPLWRGTPNLVLKSVCMRAMILSSIVNAFLQFLMRVDETEIIHQSG